MPKWSTRLLDYHISVSRMHHTQIREPELISHWVQVPKKKSICISVSRMHHIRYCYSWIDKMPLKCKTIQLLANLPILFHHFPTINRCSHHTPPQTPLTTVPYRTSLLLPLLPRCLPCSLRASPPVNPPRHSPRGTARSSCADSEKYRLITRLR